MNQFSLEYPEYHIANLLQKEFSKTENFSLSIPLSRQQKYFDLLLHNSNNRKSATIQVKSSRTYIHSETKKKKQDDYHYNAWLNNFKTVNSHTDFYFFFISFPLFDSKTFRPKTGFGVKLLVFENSEMKSLFSNIRKTKNGNPDFFFGFGFNINEEKILGTRGFIQTPKKEFKNNLFEHKIASIKKLIV